MNLKLLVIAAAVAVAAGCERLTSEFEPDPSVIAPLEVIDLTSEGSTDIAADGKATARVVALVPTNSSVKSVTFTTTAGVFVETGTKQVVIRAVNDALRPTKARAETLLRSDTSAATAIVRATIGEFYDTLSVRFIKPE